MTDQPTDELHLLTLEQVADRLNVSIDTVRRLVRDGELPVKRFGERIRRVDPSDLDLYIASL